MPDTLSRQQAPTSKCAQKESLPDERLAGFPELMQQRPLQQTKPYLRPSFPSSFRTPS